MATGWSGYVYFVRCPVNGLIKIGVSRDPGDRLVGLRTTSPVPIEPMGWMHGGRVWEQRLHRRFEALRHHSEWFEPGERLVYLIHRWANLWPGPWVEIGGHDLDFDWVAAQARRYRLAKRNGQPRPVTVLTAEEMGQ